MANASASSPMNPHFFQPLLPGFQSYLVISFSLTLSLYILTCTSLLVWCLYEFLSLQNIPMAFYSKHIKGTTDEGNANAGDKAVVKLRSDASDLTWEVKMDGRRLTQGWQEFTTSHDLRVSDIVIFRHDGDLLFHVTTFGPSCCEIQYDDVFHKSSGTISSTFNSVDS